MTFSALIAEHTCCMDKSPLIGTPREAENEQFFLHQFYNVDDEGRIEEFIGCPDDQPMWTKILLECPFFSPGMQLNLEGSFCEACMYRQFDWWCN
jgi:hypothetical protein